VERAWCRTTARPSRQRSLTGGCPPAHRTTGGTGLTPRDVTPQATAAVLDYEIPVAEAMRADGRRSTPFGALSWAWPVRGRTLIVNVPGSPRG
jgi:molybdopterin biosynthesis enzyme MoaB